MFNSIFNKRTRALFFNDPKQFLKTFAFLETKNSFGIDVSQEIT